MKLIVVVVSGILVISGCSGEPKEKKPVNWNNQQSTKLNKELAIEEDIDIKLFLARHEEWKVEETGSGLRYIVMEATGGAVPKSGQDTKVTIKASLLDGTVCYETPADEVEVFRVDQSDIESGIQEGIKKMHVGESAKLIIPSHLGHGLVGDLDKIPPLATLIVDIHLIGIQ